MRCNLRIPTPSSCWSLSPSQRQLLLRCSWRWQGSAEQVTRWRKQAIATSSCLEPQQRQQPPLVTTEPLCFIAATSAATSVPSELLRPGSDDGRPGNSLNPVACCPLFAARCLPACCLHLPLLMTPRGTLQCTDSARLRLTLLIHPLCFKTISMLNKHQQATLSGYIQLGWLASGPLEKPGGSSCRRPDVEHRGGIGHLPLASGHK